MYSYNKNGIHSDPCSYGSYLKLLQVDETSDSQNTNDGAHYYDELPCNMKKDDHTTNNTNLEMEDPSVCT